MRSSFRPKLRLAAPAAALLLSGLAAAPLFAGDVFTRLTDLRPGTASGVPYLSAAIWNGDLYFVGYVGNFDSRIYRYDGVNPPAEMTGTSVMADEIVLFDDQLFFRGGAFDDRELWRWDGVTPAVEALDLLDGGSGGFPEYLTAFGSLLCFAANTASGNEPVCWDGSNPPAIYDVRGGAQGSVPEAFAVIDGDLYFEAYDDVNGGEGRVFSGSGQPALLADLRAGTPSSSPRGWTTDGVDLWFVASDGDGQGRLYSKAAAEAPAMHPYGLDVEGEIGAWNGAVYAPGHEDANTTPYVYRFDGDLVTRLQPSVAFAGFFTPLANALYFIAGFNSPNRDLYRWCGGETIELVSTAFSSTSDAIGNGLLAHDGRLYMSASNALTTGSELWELAPMEAIFCSGFRTGDDSEWGPVF